MSEDRLIPTPSMAQDPRLRRLFALVGLCLDDEEMSDHEDGLRDVLLDVAPEYVPPDDQCDPEWRAFAEQAERP